LWGIGLVKFISAQDIHYLNYLRSTTLHVLTSTGVEPASCLHEGYWSVQALDPGRWRNDGHEIWIRLGPRWVALQTNILCYHQTWITVTA